MAGRGPHAARERAREASVPQTKRSRNAGGRKAGRQTGSVRPPGARSGRKFGSTWARRDARGDRKFGSIWPGAAAARPAGKRNRPVRQVIRPGGPAERGAQEGGTMTDEGTNRPGDELPGSSPGRAVSLDMRGRAVAAVVHGGMSASAAARLLGLAPVTVRRWVRQFREQGHVRPCKRGGSVSRIEPERGAHRRHPGGPAGADRAGAARRAGRRGAVLLREHGARVPETPPPATQTPPPPQAAAVEEGVAAGCPLYLSAQLWLPWLPWRNGRQPAVHDSGVSCSTASRPRLRGCGRRLVEAEQQSRAAGARDRRRAVHDSAARSGAVSLENRHVVDPETLQRSLV